MIVEIISMFFIAGGVFFLLVGGVGLLRLPDVYTRMHAVGKCDTLGSGLLIIGLMVVADSLSVIIKLLIVLLLIIVINPVITHLMAKVSYERGMDLADGSFVLNTYTALKREPKKESESEYKKEGEA